jgi:transketolase
MQVDWNSDVVGRVADTIRILSAEAVQRANSGHPGMPMGAADYALVLWVRHLVVNPGDPAWPNRDRFILSAGHGSMLLYSLLHLFGFGLEENDIRDFRQWGSKTPGHPEYAKDHPGVETTTGPLGQGLATGVGMALASKIVAARVNTEKFPMINHRIMGIVSDGDIMEGVASEAASLAGHLGLGNIVYIYDDNKITIEGSTGLAFSENVKKRFEAYRWHVIKADGQDRAAMDSAVSQGLAETKRPSLIMARTTIGFRCPKLAGSEKTHGAPIGEEELAAVRECLDWKSPELTVDQEVYNFCKKALEPKLEAYGKWQEMLGAFRKEEPKRAKLFEAFLRGEVPDDLEKKVIAKMPDESLATRKSSGAFLQVIAGELPFLIGGSADLAPSNNTLIKNGRSKKIRSIKKGNFKNRNLHFGIREHAMGAALNGMALYGLIPYGGTFLVFADYMRPSIRLAALMGIRVIYVFTHDSIMVGEDGPTHQPVEQVSSLRDIPNLHVIRPADSYETALAWCEAVRRTDGPTALILTRQKVPVIDRKKYQPADGLARGAYVIAGAEESAPDLLIMATGSEVGLALEAYEELSARGVKLRAISMPCLEKFDEQDRDYRDSVIPPVCKNRVAIEAGVSRGWHKYAGSDGLVLSMDRFGASAPGKVLAEKFGFNRDAVLEMIGCAFPEL